MSPRFGVGILSCFPQFPNSVKGFGLLRLHTPKMSFTPITFGAVLPDNAPHRYNRVAPRSTPIISFNRGRALYHSRDFIRFYITNWPEWIDDCNFIGGHIGSPAKIDVKRIIDRPFFIGWLSITCPINTLQILRYCTLLWIRHTNSILQQEVWTPVHYKENETKRSHQSQGLLRASPQLSSIEFWKEMKCEGKKFSWDTIYREPRLKQKYI